MTQFAVCDNATGAILCTGICRDADIPLQGGETGFVVRLDDEAVMDDTTHYWRDGEGWTAYPPQPSPHHVFDFVAQAWGDPRDVAEIEARAREAGIATARAYLADTDWYVTRLVETGAPIPEEIATARAEARVAAGA